MESFSCSCGSCPGDIVSEQLLCSGDEHDQPAQGEEPEVTPDVWQDQPTQGDGLEEVDEPEHTPHALQGHPSQGDNFEPIFEALQDQSAQGAEPGARDELAPLPIVLHDQPAQGEEPEVTPDVWQDQPAQGDEPREGVEPEPMLDVLHDEPEDVPDVLQDGAQLARAPHEIEEVSDENAGDGNDPSQPSDHHISQTTIEDLHPPAKLLWNKRAFFYTLIACMTSVMLAYGQVVMNGAATSMKTDLAISDEHYEVVTGLLNLWTFFGLVIARLISDRFGRWWTIMTAGIMYFAGPLIMGLASNYAVFLVGRSVANFGSGFALMIAPVYVAEISPSFSRGFFTSFPQVFINFGTILGNISTYYLSKLRLNLGWRVIIITGVIPSVVLALVFLAMPESPKWLIMKGRLRDAKRVLAKTSNSEEEAVLQLSDMKKAAGIPEDCNEDVVAMTNWNTGVWRDLLHPTRSVCHLLACAILIQFFQQTCGMDTLLEYSSRIFEKVQITSSYKKLLMSIGIDVVKTVFVLIAAFHLDRVGRRPLLLSSIGGMIVSLISLGICLILIKHSGAKVMCITMLFVYVASFSIGMGPIADLYSSEIFPVKLRSQGYTIGVAVKQAVRLLLSLNYLLLSKAIGLGGTAIVFAGFMIIAWVVLYLLVPETKGRTAEEMEMLFGKLPYWRSTMKVVEHMFGKLPICRSMERAVEMQRIGDPTEAVARSE